MDLTSTLPFIKLNNVSLKYPINFQAEASIKQDILKTFIGGTISKKNSRHTSITALKNLDFTISNGDCVHLKGHNGAGKSTLLRLLAGIYTPTSGEIQRNGEVMSLLGLSAGALMKCTGIENIYRILMLNGMSKNEAEAYIPYISEFSELEEFLHLPVSSYSDGMLVRLMFSIATCRTPEILIIDEIIGAGDAQFSKKSQERINEMIDQSFITIIATHSDPFASEICNRVMTLEHGSLVD